MPFANCSDRDLYKFFYDSNSPVSHNISVNFHCMDDRFLNCPFSDNPELECDLLVSVDRRNSTNCVLAESPE